MSHKLPVDRQTVEPVETEYQASTHFAVQPFPDFRIACPVRSFPVEGPAIDWLCTDLMLWGEENA